MRVDAGPRLNWRENYTLLLVAEHCCCDAAQGICEEMHLWENLFRDGRCLFPRPLYRKEWGCKQCLLTLQRFDWRGNHWLHHTLFLNCHVAYVVHVAMHMLCQNMIFVSLKFKVVRKFASNLNFTPILNVHCTLKSIAVMSWCQKSKKFYQVYNIVSLSVRVNLAWKLERLYIHWYWGRKEMNGASRQAKVGRRPFWSNNSLPLDEDSSSVFLHYIANFPIIIHISQTVGLQRLFPGWILVV